MNTVELESSMRVAHRCAAPALSNVISSAASPAGAVRELAAGVVDVVGSAPVERWLRVVAGRVWATRTVRHGQPDDQWLEAGEYLRLPAGSAWVLEGGPQAHVSLLQAWPQNA
ncbi:MAG: DUF2917 domain-containing protein [Burkholderiales bacterium]|nr:DUF2917 domain-containing protein [Burkholderiales bacterium]